MEAATENAAADFAIQISTDSVPERERVAYFRESLGRSLVRLDLGPYGDRTLRWAARLHGFDGLSVLMGRTNGNIIRRSQPLLTREATRPRGGPFVQRLTRLATGGQTDGKGRPNRPTADLAAGVTGRDARPAGCRKWADSARRSR